MRRWDECRFLTCSVLPVRLACPCDCPFCFSKSSVSALASEPAPWADDTLRAHYRWAAARGATRLVVTGGGEPLLRPEVCLRALRVGSEVFAETALFTSGTTLTADLAVALADAGLTYLCWSRHAVDDEANRALMGPAAPDADVVLDACATAGLPIRATCVMSTAGVADASDAARYLDAMARRGVRQLTFKHTYVAHDRSVFASSPANRWARAHQVEADPLAGWGEVVSRLPWGPAIRRLGEVQACHYWEPTPDWELAHGLARSSNLLSDGSVYASLEDDTSLLGSLPTPASSPSSTPAPWPPPSDPTRSRASGPSCPSATAPVPTPTVRRSPTSTPTR